MPSALPVFAGPKPTKKRRVFEARQRNEARALGTNHRRWRRIRQQLLNAEPLCRSCKDSDRITPANEIDHADGDAYNNAPDNLVPLCKPCHSRKTAADQLAKRQDDGS